MATIAFFVDFDIGHIFPTFGLASDLVAHKHRVVYFGIPDVEQTVRENGFEFYPVFADIYPLGYIKKFARKPSGQLADSSLYGMVDHLIQMMQLNVFWPTLEQICPDLLITNFFIMLEATIVYYKTRLPQVIFVPFFMGNSLADIVLSHFTKLSDEIFTLYNFAEQQGFRITNLRDLLTPISKFPAIIPCPREFELPDAVEVKNIQYIEPLIRKPISQQQFHWSAIPPDSKIIFASLGSLAHRDIYDKEKIRSFFRKMIEMMNSPLAKDWHLILSFGLIENLEEIESLPSSITALRWVPQIEVLQRASLMITHGGLGTIKECIFYGVPMIVCPMGNDQFINSKRIIHHKLGKELDIVSTPIENILETVDDIMNNQTIQQSVKNMQQVFRRYEDAHLGVKLIESILENTKQQDRNRH